MDAPWPSFAEVMEEVLATASEEEIARWRAPLQLPLVRDDAVVRAPNYRRVSVPTPFGKRTFVDDE